VQGCNLNLLILSGPCRSITFDAPGLSAEEGCAGQQTQTFRCDGAGVKVVFEAKEIAGELYRVKPAVGTSNLEPASQGRLLAAASVSDLQLTRAP